MITRLGRYVAVSYPIPFSLCYAALLTLGVTGLFAAADPRPHGWGPGAGALVPGLTVFVDLLLLRAADDIRDLDYDRRHHPGRPLASGAVRVCDLLAMIGAGAVALLALNAGNAAAAALVAAQLGYAAALLAAGRWVRFPSGDAVVLGLAMSCPVQLLLLCYLYAGYLRSAGLSPDGHGAVAIAAVALMLLHVELARKTTRSVQPGERSYVTVLGPSGTAGAAVASAFASLLVVLPAVRPWPAVPDARAALGWLVVLPPALVALGAVRFWGADLARWPGALSVLYVFASLLMFLVVGLSRPAGIA